MTGRKFLTLSGIRRKDAPEEKSSSPCDGLPLNLLDVECSRRSKTLIPRTPTVALPTDLLSRLSTKISAQPEVPDCVLNLGPTSMDLNPDIDELLLDHLPAMGLIDHLVVLHGGQRVEAAAITAFVAR